MLLVNIVKLISISIILTHTDINLIVTHTVGLTNKDTKLIVSISDDNIIIIITITGINDSFENVVSY